MCVSCLAYTQKLSAQSSLSSEWHTERAESLFNAGEYRQAFREYSEALKLYDDTEDNAAAARLEYRRAISAAKGELTEGVELLEEFIEAHPGSEYASAARLGLGGIYLERGEYMEAIRVFNQVAPERLTPEEQDEYNFKRGYAYFKTEEWDKVYRYMAKIDPRSRYWAHAQYCMGYADYRQGNYASARNYFANIENHEAYVDIVPFYMIHIEFGDRNYRYVTDNGVRFLERAKGERALELLRMIGEAWFHQQNWGETITYITKYSKQGGAMGREENYLSGYSYYMSGDYQRAESYLSRVAGIDDKLSQNASYHLADTYLKLGDKQRAMQSFAIASTRGYDDTISEDALFNYGKLQYELGSGHFNEAVNVLNRYLTNYPASPRVGEAREYLVAAYYNANDYDAAYNAIIQMENPDNDVKAALQKITYFRALQYYNKSNLNEAWRWLEISLQNRYNPKYTALAGFWQGEILYREGKYGEAAAKFDAYIKAAPKTEKEAAMARYNIGYSYFNQKNWSKARTWFEDFLSVYKTNDSYRADVLNRMGDIEYSGRAYWKAIEQYDAAAKIGTEERFYSAFQRAMMLGMVDRPQRKIESLSEIANKNAGPYAEQAMYELARAYISQGQFKNAETTLKTYIPKYPDSPRYAAALSDLGLVYQNLGMSDEALIWYKKAVQAGKNTEQGKTALQNVRNIYLEDSNAQGYFDYAGQAGVEADLGAMERDSIAFAAARNAYLSGNKDKAAESLSGYLQNYPDGAYIAEALYYSGENALARDRKDAAYAHFQRLAGIQTNEFTLKGMEKLAPLAMEKGEYGVAADTYKRVAENQTNVSRQADSWSGYMKAVIARGNTDDIVRAADEVTGRTSDKRVVREATFAKANALQKGGNKDEAMKLYEQLSGEVNSAEGAESAYIVIHEAYASGNKERAEKLVVEFAKGDTSQPYWLAKAFLTLGDIYADKGDSFQARATYQSIVDGYSNKTDGIIDEAQKRISRLK